MSQYLLLPNIHVQNANAISGLTYGFPGITNFLGFAHALSRKLPNALGVHLGGVLVACHQHQIHAKQPKGWGGYVFALTRNPLVEDKKNKGNFISAPFVEEGRMNMEVSLLIEIHGLISGDLEIQDALLDSVQHHALSMRLAGGQIISMQKANIAHSEHTHQIMRRLMPGFVLVDRSNYLIDHYREQQQTCTEFSMLDAWCDFAALTYEAVTADVNPEDSSIDKDVANTPQTHAQWRYKAKPNGGYLVPITSGYCAISEVHEPGTVTHTRDSDTPAVFAEAAYTIGEWLSPHRLTTIDDAIWRYEYAYPWYIAKSTPFVEAELIPDIDDAPFDPNDSY